MDIYRMVGVFALRLCSAGTVLLASSTASAVVGGAPPLPGFYHVGDLPGGAVGSRIMSVSGDGSTVVGNSYSPGRSQAIRWTFQGGLEGLAGPHDNVYPQEAHGVSFDGSVIVGAGSDASLTPFPYRWTQSTGAQSLGLVPGDVASLAKNVSADGSVVVGFSAGPAIQQGFRWSASTGMVGMGYLPGAEARSEARAVSADGSVVVGYSFNTSPSWEAIRWTDTGGLQGLGGHGSYGNDVSADGSLVVGSLSTFTGRRLAGKWEEVTGWRLFQDSSDVKRSEATATSANGSIAVGNRENNAGQVDAFIWTETTGVQLLTPLLQSYGFSGLDGWSLRGATDVSADGRVIVGTGINPQGIQEGWVVVLPAPGTGIAACVCLGLAVSRRRR